MATGTEDDEDWWPGVGEATEWEFPVARLQDTSSYLVVHNPGLTAVEVSVDLFTADGTILEAFTATVAPDAPARFDLSQYPGDPMAARVMATGRVRPRRCSGDGEVADGRASEFFDLAASDLRRLPPPACGCSSRGGHHDHGHGAEQRRDFKVTVVVPPGAGAGRRHVMEAEASCGGASPLTGLTATVRRPGFHASPVVTKANDKTGRGGRG
jgi:hypothetical protein